MDCVICGKGETKTYPICAPCERESAYYGLPAAGIVGRGMLVAAGGDGVRVYGPGPIPVIPLCGGCASPETHDPITCGNVIRGMAGRGAFAEYGPKRDGEPSWKTRNRAIGRDSREDGLWSKVFAQMETPPPSVVDQSTRLTVVAEVVTAILSGVKRSYLWYPTLEGEYYWPIGYKSFATWRELFETAAESGQSEAVAWLAAAKCDNGLAHCYLAWAIEAALDAGMDEVVVIEEGIRLREKEDVRWERVCSIPDPTIP